MLRWLVAGAVWLMPCSVFAQTLPPAPSAAYELVWTATSGCPSKHDVQNEIERLLGTSKSQTRGPKVSADARVTPTQGGFELELTLQQSDVTRSRRLMAPTCEELGKAAGLVVAMAVDPTLAPSNAGEPVPSAPPPCPEPPPAAPPPPPVQCPVCRACQPPPPLAPPAPPKWSTGLLVGASVSYGELPRVWPRPQLGLVHRVGGHWLELSLGAAFARTSALESGRVATFDQWYAAPRYCLESSGAGLRFAGCATAELGLLNASGFGVDVTRTQHEFWLAAGAGLQVTGRLGFGADALAGVDVLVMPDRPQFELAAANVFTPHLVVPGLRLALVGGLF